MSMSSPNSGYRGDSSLGVWQIIGDALNVSVKSYLGNFFINLPLLIAGVATFGSSFFSLSPEDRLANQLAVQQNMGRFAVLEIVIIVLSIIASCAMTRLVHDRYVGAPISATASAVAGTKRSLSIFGLSLVIVLAYFGFALVVGLTGMLLQFVLGAFAYLIAVVLAIFGLYLAFPYLLSGIVCINEERGPFASLGRSKFLTDQYRWPLLGMLVVTFIILVIYYAVFFGISFALESMPYGRTLLLVVTALVSPLLGGWMIGLLVIAAHRLRMLKDGVMSSRTLSNVFE